MDIWFMVTFTVFLPGIYICVKVDTIGSTCKILITAIELFPEYLPFLLRS